jgi:predicted Zn finger-like uncharacterized protein
VIVTCERCATQFQLDDSRVPARGVRVRCSRCKNAFRVVPEGQRAAEQIAELSRRAREDSQEETTQDLAGDSRSRSRSGSRRAEASAAHASESGHGTTGSGLDGEESDWKFNEDVSAEADAPVHAREEAKPDPPATRRGAEADDWFRGGGNTPLELDDRPWNASAEGATAPEVEQPPEAADAADSAGAAVPEEEPTADPGLDRFTEPEESEEQAPFEASPPEDDLDALASVPSLARESEAQEPAQAGTDELSSDRWDEMFGKALAEGAEEAAAPAAERAPSRRRGFSLPSFGGVGARVGRWLGYGAQAVGWVVTTALFGAGLYAGLAARSPALPASAREQVGGFELSELEGRFVDNAVSGRLYVVSGHVHNTGAAVGMVQGLAVELLDVDGQPLGQRAALHPVFETSSLRESPVSDLSAPQPPFRIAPGEARAVEGIFASLPPEAAAFRVVAAPSGRGSGSLPEVQLPR